MEMNNGVKSKISASSGEVRMAFDQYQSAFANSLFSTCKHQASVNGDSGSLTQPFIPIPNFTLPEEDMACYIPWSHNAHDDPYQLIQCTQNNIKSRNVTDRADRVIECEGETDLHGLVSNILEEADSLDSYYTEGNSCTFKPVWSPKTVREDLQQYKTQPSAPFLPNRTHHESFNKAQGQQMAKDVEELCQQFSGFDATRQWLCNSSNGDMDSYSPQPQKLPPGLPMPSMGNSYLSQIRQSKHDYISADKDRGNREPMNNFPGLNDVFAPQSKMSSRCFDPYYEDRSIQSSVKPMSNEQYAAQVNKLVSNFQVLMAGEHDSLHYRESENTSRQTMEMHYEDSMAEQWKFISPAVSTHNTPTMQIQKEPVGECGAVQREINGVRKQTFQGDNSSQDLPGFNPQNTEYFQQPKPLSASFKSPNQYQNKMATHRGNASLPVSLSLNQYLQQSQMQNKFKPPRVNCGPPKPSTFLSPSVSEFVPQHSHQMQRGPLCVQNYGHRDGPTIHCRPGQGQVGTGLDSGRKRDGDSEMQLEKNRMHTAGFLGEGFSAQTQTSTHMREGDRNPYFDLLGSMRSPQRFGGGTVSAGAKFVPSIYPVSDPRKHSCHMPFNSSNFSSRSSLPYGSGIPVMDLGDMMPDNEFTAFNPYLSDLMVCSGKSIYPGMASALRSPRMMKNQGGPMSQLHFYLEESYEQWRYLEKERKKAEVILTKIFPGKRTAAVTSTTLPLNPTRVDHLIVNQIREQARVVSLLCKMESLCSVPLHANISSALDRHYMAICDTQSRRKEEFANMSNRQRQGGAHFRKDRDTVLLAVALKDLCAATRKTRTALWCALQMTLPKSVKRLDQHVDMEAPCEASSPEKYSYSFNLLI